jgi:hypothetical protein
MVYKQYYTKNGEQLEIKIKDSTYRVVYKARVNISDSSNIAKILMHIENTFGVRIAESIQNYLEESKNEAYFDTT